MNKKITPAVVGIALSLSGLALAAVPEITAMGMAGNSSTKWTSASDDMPGM